MKRNIAIVAGGDSSEIVISLKSAEGIFSFLDKDKYNVYIAIVKRDEWAVKLPGGEHTPIDKNDFSFRENGEIRHFDFAYITIHGTPGEDGRLQGYFDMIGMPYSSCGMFVSALTFNKFACNHYLKGFGVDTARITTEVENIQFELFVTNEKSAISWLYQQLDEQFCGPQTYAELQPKFMQEVKAVDKYEQMPELATILEENFLQDGKGRWYIPDVTKEGDLVKLREKNLWKEFEGYMNSKGKLKLFRSEAIRVGFSRLWKEKNYKAIVDIAERLPEQTIQEDSNLLMYYDISLGRV